MPGPSSSVDSSFELASIGPNAYLPRGERSSLLEIDQFLQQLHLISESPIRMILKSVFFDSSSYAIDVSQFSALLNTHKLSPFDIHILKLDQFTSLELLILAIEYLWNFEQKTTRFKFALLNRLMDFPEGQVQASNYLEYLKQFNDAWRPVLYAAESLIIFKPRSGYDFKALILAMKRHIDKNRDQHLMFHRQNTEEIMSYVDTLPIHNPNQFPYVHSRTIIDLTSKTLVQLAIENKNIELLKALYKRADIFSRVVDIQQAITTGIPEIVELLFVRIDFSRGSLLVLVNQAYSLLDKDQYCANRARIAEICTFHLLKWDQNSHSPESFLRQALSLPYLHKYDASPSVRYFVYVLLLGHDYSNLVLRQVLSWALAKRDDRIINFLLTKKNIRPDVNQLLSVFFDKQLFRPLSSWCQNLDSLSDGGESLLGFAIANKHLDDAIDLIKKGALVSQRNPQGDNFLHRVIRETTKPWPQESDKLMLLDELLKSPSASSALERENNEYLTPLQLAISVNNHAMVRRLISSGANIEKQNTLRFNALTCAVWYKDPEMIRILSDKVIEKTLAEFNDTDPFMQEFKDQLTLSPYKDQDQLIRELVIGRGNNTASPDQETADSGSDLESTIAEIKTKLTQWRVYPNIKAAQEAYATTIASSVPPALVHHVSAIPTTSSAPCIIPITATLLPGSSTKIMLASLSNDQRPLRPTVESVDEKIHGPIFGSVPSTQEDMPCSDLKPPL